MRGAGVIGKRVPRAPGEPQESSSLDAHLPGCLPGISACVQISMVLWPSVHKPLAGCECLSFAIRALGVDNNKKRHAWLPQRRTTACPCGVALLGSHWLPLFFVATSCSDSRPASHSRQDSAGQLRRTTACHFGVALLGSH